MDPRKTTLNTLLVGAWFGLGTGLLEGMAFLITQEYGHDMGVSLEIVWISALVDVLLFSTVALALVALTRVLHRLPSTRITVFVFHFPMLSSFAAGSAI